MIKLNKQIQFFRLTNHFHDRSFPGNGFLQLLHAEWQLSWAADLTKCFTQQPHRRSSLVLTGLSAQKT